jgi:hypothetical protein
MLPGTATGCFAFSEQKQAPPNTKSFRVNKGRASHRLHQSIRVHVSARSHPCLGSVTVSSVVDHASEAPEAYTLKAALDDWIVSEDGRANQQRAAQTYDKY